MQTTTHEIKELIDRACSNGHAIHHGASWEFYESALDELGDSHVRLAYDQGELEFMSPPSHEHDFCKKLIARMVEAIAFALKRNLLCGGSTTWKRRDLKRGIEPDECYWIQNYTRVKGRNIDLTNDPPPDLVVEIDISHSSLDRQNIYAALKVPELWRYEDGNVAFMHLDSNGTYVLKEFSLAFPKLTSADFSRQLKVFQTRDDFDALEALSSWARANL